jgi:hypothetical protein
VGAIIEKPDPRPASFDGDPGGRGPWLLVMERGHGRLVTELQALFRDDTRVRVIEDRRDRSALLPRPDVGPRPPGA